MKKIATLISALLISALGLYGQCEPDPQYTLPGIYPDSATGFPIAFASYEYNLVITAIIPFDTIVPPLPRLQIDSIGVVEINGLPEGFEALPNSASGYWHGGTSGCLLITGTPTIDQIGEYPLNIKLVGYMGGINIPFPAEINYYSIVVMDSAAMILPDLANVVKNKPDAYPNPFEDVININFDATKPGNFECLVYDTKQQLMISRIFTGHIGKNSFRMDGSALKPGMYYCVIRQSGNNTSTTLKLIKH